MTKSISNKKSTVQVSKKLFAFPVAFAALGFFGCKDDNGEVEFCQSYYFNNTTSETDYATCADCESGYQLFKNECFPQGSCVAGNCTTCTATNTTQCEVCDQGYAFDYFGECEGQCLNDSRCSDCNSDYTACNACRAPYTLDENGVCSICDVEHCTECRPPPFGCVSCEDGYFVQLNFREPNSEPNSCEACTLSNCLECVNNVSGPLCRTCADGFRLVGDVCVPE